MGSSMLLCINVATLFVRPFTTFTFVRCVFILIRHFIFKPFAQNPLAGLPAM